jgi:type I restriction enzyme S subunit
LIGVWSDKTHHNDFIFFGVKKRIDVLLQSATGGAQQHVNKANVEELAVPWLSDEEITRWHRVAGPLMQATSELLFEARTIEDAKKELLPHLIEGRIRVPNKDAA